VVAINKLKPTFTEMLIKDRIINSHVGLTASYINAQSASYAEH